MTGEMIAVLADFSLRDNNTICSPFSPVDTLLHYSAETESERKWKRKICDERERKIEKNMRD